MREMQKESLFPLLQTSVPSSMALLRQAQQEWAGRLRFDFQVLVFPITRYDKWLNGCKAKPCKQNVLKFQVSVIK